MKMFKSNGFALTSIMLFCAILLGACALAFATKPAGATTPPVPGYLMFRASFHDADALAAYGRAVGALAAEFGGSFVVVSASPELLEGEDDGRRLVLLRFEDVARARAFWSSEAYARVKQLRANAGHVDAVLVEGIPGR
jgi:uncharacterized protein (DUF1330 family)